MILLLLACQGTPETPPAPADVISDPAYRFCHEAGLYGESATQFCDLLDGLPEDRCPGLRETCAGAAPITPSNTGCSGTSQETSSESLPASAPEPPPPDPMKCEAPEDLEGLEPLLRWITALLVALLVLFVFRFVWRFFGWRRQDPMPVTHDRPDVPDEDEDFDVDLPEGSGEDLLGGAWRALEAGRLGEAVELARAAALRALGAAGHLRLHRARTDREYLRALRKEAERRTALRTVVSAVEQHRWGGQMLNEQQARTALDAARGLVEGAAILFALLLAAPADAQTPWRYSPLGDAGLVRVYERYGYQATWRLRPLHEVNDETDVLVLDLSGLTPDEAAWTAIRDWVAAGGVLFVGGDGGAGWPEIYGHLVALEDASEPILWDPLVLAGLPTPRWPDGPSQAFDHPEDQPLVVIPRRDQEPLAAVTLLSHGEGSVIAVADPRLLYNGSLVHPANEQFLGELFLAARALWAWPVQTPIRVQVATVAAASESSPSGPTGALANARLLPFVLQLLLCWIVLALWRGWPFSPLRDPPGEGRQRFAAHVEAVGRRYRQLGATGWAWHTTARYWWTRLGPLGLTAAARRAGRTDREATDFARHIQAAAEMPPTANDAAHLEHMEELWDLTRPR